MIKRHAVWIIFVSAALLLSACGRETEAPAFEPVSSENVLRFDSPYSFASLSPIDEYGGGAYAVFPFLYSFLCVPEPTGRLHPDVAASWRYVQETFTWYIQLRSDVRFHSGKPLTAADVKYSIQCIDKARPNLISTIKTINNVSEDFIEIRLTKNDPEFLRKVWDAEIIPEGSRNSMDFYNQPVGSGPFRFKAREGENRIELTTNEDYYDGRPSLDGVVFQYVPDKEKTLARLLSGETDMTQDMSPKNYEMIRQYESRFDFETVISDWYTILLYNTNNPLFSDARVRRALTHAIDRDYIVKEILDGKGIVAAGPMGIDTPYHHPGVEPLAYDPEMALKLLNQAGWRYGEHENCLYRNGKPLSFTLIIPKEYEIEKRVVQYIKICLNDIGIRMHIQALPEHKATACYYMNNEFQAVLTQHSGAAKRIESLKNNWSPHPSGKAWSGCFSHPEVTRLLDHALNCENAEKRTALMQKADKLLWHLQPGTFLYHQTHINVLSKRFELRYPFELTHHGLYFLKYAKLTRN